MASSRPKRLAAQKAKTIVIEISDSDEDVLPTKKQRYEQDNSFCELDYAQNKHVRSKNRWPDKEKENLQSLESSKETARKKGGITKQNNEINGKEIKEINSDNILINNIDDGSINRIPTNHEHNEFAGQTITQHTGRSSFWARRKVWNVHELLAETECIELNAAQNIVNLFNNENTIPFICRYRRDLVNEISPERLRDIKNSYTEILNLRKKAENIVNQLEKDNIINEEIRIEMMCAKSPEELEFLYAPYKPANKGTLADRAKALGLEKCANQLLLGEGPKVYLRNYIDRNNSNLDDEIKVEAGIIHIVSHIISKHTGVLEQLRKLQKSTQIFLTSTKSKTTLNKNTEAPTIKKDAKSDISKYENYFNFQSDIRHIKPHQVLAINRGEKQKFLSVKIIIAENFKIEIKRYIHRIFMDEGLQYDLRDRIFELSFEDSYNKKLQLLTSRQIRADLNETAKKASIEVFAKNLKQLLLCAPLKGEKILGIDPGFTNGCKYAMISETAEVLETGVMYLHTRNKDPAIYAEQLTKLLTKHNCKVIALGNGTACRETEEWLSKLICHNILDPRFIRYSIVSEQGASIYSCSEIAKKEFPKMDVNQISAVSIARRLNDPLSEYVKIEPRHIGVGMYQHDINEKALTGSLNEVVSECVSYVGVDINTASISVLKHIAGLGDKKAQKIIDHRLKNGPFKTREDLLQVKLIGAKTFQQCAGFVRIEPLSVGGNVQNLLDCTWVHPESYNIAKKIISICKLNLKDIGKPSFIEKIKDYEKSNNLKELSNDFKIPIERLEIVFVALKRNLLQDYRQDLNKGPLFKQGIKNFKDLSIGDVVTGAVTNITHFGAFVDVGVERNGLIHISKMRNINLNIGDRVTTSIHQIDFQKGRLGLRLEKVLADIDLLSLPE
ncbi:S1 RNA-binding domain-containing protein 1 [Teleopsis dalmanni]|uniref:S1 RNA-binding domain-containing protein 1 n=1 Tax=Teleopsis dalmanni TaxID=139649 RepID=UPI0018CFB86B|nr:S1 RNA-binding domain-containing protein 1 [Teleopsis dalmanni]